jgi:hypothetical protein
MGMLFRRHRHKVGKYAEKKAEAPKAEAAPVEPKKKPKKAKAKADGSDSKAES